MSAHHQVKLLVETCMIAMMRQRTHASLGTCIILSLLISSKSEFTRLHTISSTRRCLSSEIPPAPHSTRRRLRLYRHHARHRPTSIIRARGKFNSSLYTEDLREVGCSRTPKHGVSVVLERGRDGQIIEIQTLGQQLRRISRSD